MSRTRKGLEFYPVHELASYLDTVPWVLAENTGLLSHRQKTVNYNSNRQSRIIFLLQFPTLQWSQVDTPERGGTCTCRGYITGEEPHAGSQGFIMGLCPRGMRSLYYTDCQQIFLLSQKRHCFSFPRLFAHRCSWKDHPEQKLSVPVHTMLRNTKDPWKLSPNT